VRRTVYFLFCINEPGRGSAVRPDILSPAVGWRISNEAKRMRRHLRRFQMRGRSLTAFVYTTSKESRRTGRGKSAEKFEAIRFPGGGT
jgi:hypothetical protein